MNWFNFDLRKSLWVIAVTLIPLISINSQKSIRQVGWVDRPFALIASSIEHSYFAFAESIRGTARLYANLVGIKRDNLRLQDENQALQTRLNTFAELQKENQRLYELLSFRSGSKMQLIAAQVISRDMLPDHASIQINKGTKDGLQHGQAVITTHGVVGHIFRPQELSSHVLLISDRFSVVDGRVSRSRARGIVEGKGQSGCSFLYVEKSEDVKPGDTIVTTGLDNIFPKGFAIATVEHVENKPYAVSLKVDLKPEVDPKKIEEVFVIVNAAEEDLSNKQVQQNANPEKTNL